MERFVVYVSNYDGKAKNSGKPFHMITLIDYDPKEKAANKREFFTEERLPILDTLKFGDIVKPYFEESNYLGGKPRFCGLDKVSDSPYF